MTEDIKAIADAGATGAAAGAVFGFLPDVAAALSILWLSIRIYEWARLRIFKLPPTNGGFE